MRFTLMLCIFALLFTGCRDGQRRRVSNIEPKEDKPTPLRDLVEVFGDQVGAQEAARGYAASLENAKQALLSSEDTANQALLHAAATGVRASISQRDRSTSMALLALALSRAPDLATRAEVRALLRSQKELPGTDLANVAVLAAEVELNPRQKSKLTKAATQSIHSPVAALVLAQARLRAGDYDGPTLTLLDSAQRATQSPGSTALIGARLALGYADPEQALRLLADVPGTLADVLRLRAGFLMPKETSDKAAQSRITIAQIELLRPPLKHDAFLWRGEIALARDNHEITTRAITSLLAEAEGAPLGTLLSAMQHLAQSREDSAWTLLQSLSDEDFVSPDHRALWRWNKVKALMAQRQQNPERQAVFEEACLDAERFDGDRYRGAMARAKVRDDREALRSVFLYAPFVGALSEHLEIEGEDPKEAIALLAARRALAFSAPSYARQRLKTTQCTPCIALRAVAEKDKGAALKLLKSKPKLGPKDREALAF